MAYQCAAGGGELLSWYPPRNLLFDIRNTPHLKTLGFHNLLPGVKEMMRFGYQYPLAISIDLPFLRPRLSLDCQHPWDKCLSLIHI